jgi:hypothetical protein
MGIKSKLKDMIDDPCLDVREGVWMRENRVSSRV